MTTKDDGPQTHSEKLKVEYDQVMYALHRCARAFCTPGIHSGIPELAVLLERNTNALAKQINPTDYDHAPTLHCFLQVIEGLGPGARPVVAEVGALADVVTIPRSPRAEEVGAPDDLLEAMSQLEPRVSRAMQRTIARLQGGKRLDAVERTEAREALYGIVAYAAHLISRIRLP